MDNPLVEFFGESWGNALLPYLDEPWMEDIGGWINYCSQADDVCPSITSMFRAFHLTPLEEVKVVILGQDPYHNGHADGLAFSSQQVDWPYSIGPILRQIYLDLTDEEDPNRPSFSCLFRSANLEPWARQGVLLVNSALSTESGTAGAHSGIWQPFTKSIVQLVAAQARPIVWMFWGGHARTFVPRLVPESHLVLTSGHPAAAAYGTDTFSGNKHFKRCLEHFNKYGIDPIDWRLNPIEVQSWE